MTTSITINSLQRYDYERETTSEPNPFDFHLSTEITSNWIFKRRPFSRTGLTKVTDGFSVKVCRVFIPKSLVPEQQPILFLQVVPEVASLIDKQIGPKLKADNIFEGITGTCSPYVTNFGTYANVWTLYPASPSQTPTHWIYESCTDVSINTDWKGLRIHVRIRDQMGYILVPPNAPADGLTGFTGNMCNFNLTCPVQAPTGCKPSKKSKTYSTDIIAWKKEWDAYRCQVCLPDPSFYPFFQKDNQVIVILNVTYTENDALGLETCFS